MGFFKNLVGGSGAANAARSSDRVVADAVAPAFGGGAGVSVGVGGHGRGPGQAGPAGGDSGEVGGLEQRTREASGTSKSTQQSQSQPPSHYQSREHSHRHQNADQKLHQPHQVSNQHQHPQSNSVVGPSFLNTAVESTPASSSSSSLSSSSLTLPSPTASSSKSNAVPPQTRSQRKIHPKRSNEGFKVPYPKSHAHAHTHTHTDPNSHSTPATHPHRHTHIRPPPSTSPTPTPTPPAASTSTSTFTSTSTSRASSPSPHQQSGSLDPALERKRNASVNGSGRGRGRERGRMIRRDVDLREKVIDDGQDQMEGGGEDEDWQINRARDRIGQGDDEGEEELVEEEQGGERDTERREEDGERENREEHGHRLVEDDKRTNARTRTTRFFSNTWTGWGDRSRSPSMATSRQGETQIRAVSNPTDSTWATSKSTSSSTAASLLRPSDLPSRSSSSFVSISSASNTTFRERLQGSLPLHGGYGDDQVDDGGHQTSFSDVPALGVEVSTANTRYSRDKSLSRPPPKFSRDHTLPTPPLPRDIIVTPSSPNGRLALDGDSDSGSDSDFGADTGRPGMLASESMVLDRAEPSTLGRDETIKPSRIKNGRGVNVDDARARKLRHSRSLGLGKPKLIREFFNGPISAVASTASFNTNVASQDRAFTEPAMYHSNQQSQTRNTSDSTLTVPILKSPTFAPSGFGLRSPSPTSSIRTIAFARSPKKETHKPSLLTGSDNTAATRRLPLRKARSFSDIFNSPLSSSLKQAMQDDHTPPFPSVGSPTTTEFNGMKKVSLQSSKTIKSTSTTNSSGTSLMKSAANLLRRKKNQDKLPPSPMPMLVLDSQPPPHTSISTPTVDSPTTFSPSLEPTTAAIPIHRNRPLSQLPEHSPMQNVLPPDYFASSFSRDSPNPSPRTSILFARATDSPVESPSVDSGARSAAVSPRSSISDKSPGPRHHGGSFEAAADIVYGFNKTNRGSLTPSHMVRRHTNHNLSVDDAHQRRAHSDSPACMLRDTTDQEFGRLFDGSGLGKRPSMSKRSNSANSDVFGRMKQALSSGSLGRTATLRRQDSTDYVHSPSASTSSLISQTLRVSRQTSFDGTASSSTIPRVGLGISGTARMSIASSVSSFGSELRRGTDWEEQRPSGRQRSSTMFSAPTSHFGTTTPVFGTPPRKRPSNAHRLSTALFGSSPGSSKEGSLFPLPARGSRSSVSASEGEREEPPRRPTPKDLPEIDMDEDTSSWLARVRQVVPESDLLSVLTLRNDSHFKAARHLHLVKFNFSADALDVALRRLLLESTLPKESQQIDRVIEAFANHYVACHPDLFLDKDHPYVIAFSLMMLHTDVFNKNNKHKMTKADYVRNTRMDGLPPIVLETFYDNITCVPFRHLEDEHDLLQMTRPTLKSRRKSILIDPPSTSTAPQLEIYQLISSGTVTTLRVDFAECALDSNPVSYMGTRPFLDYTMLRSAAIGAPTMEVDKPKLRKRSGATLLPGNKPGAIDRDETPARLKIIRVGLLSRKDDISDAGRKVTSRRWKSWSVILTGSQLIFLKDSTWAVMLLEQIEAGTMDRLSSFKPDEVFNLDEAIAVYDRSYNKYSNTFRLLMPRGSQYLFQASDEYEMNEWVASINYASAYRAAGLRVPDRRDSMEMEGEVEARSRRPSASTSDADDGEEVYDENKDPAEHLAEDGLDLATVEAASIAFSSRSSSMDQAESVRIAGSLPETTQPPRPDLSRLQNILNRIEEFTLTRHSVQKSLNESLRLARNLSILTPFLRTSRDRIQVLVPGLAREIRNRRFEVAKYTCWIEVLKDELRMSPGTLTVTSTFKGSGLRRRGLSDVSSRLSLSTANVAHSADSRQHKSTYKASPQTKARSWTMTNPSSYLFNSSNETSRGSSQVSSTLPSAPVLGHSKSDPRAEFLIPLEVSPSTHITSSAASEFDLGLRPQAQPRRSEEVDGAHKDGSHLKLQTTTTGAYERERDRDRFYNATTPKGLSFDRSDLNRNNNNSNSSSNPATGESSSTSSRLVPTTSNDSVESVKSFHTAHHNQYGNG